MQRFATLVIKFRIPVIIVTILLTLVAACSIVKWAYVESDISKLLPQDDPVVTRFREASELFGGASVGMVGIEFENVFRLDALQLVQRVTQALQTINAVSWVVSLTAMDDIRPEIIDGEKAVSVNLVVDPQNMPTTKKQLQALRQYVLGREQLVGVVVSQDGRLANIAFNVREGADRADTAAAVRKRVQSIVTNHNLYFAGFPFWMKSMSDVVLHDMLLLVPFVSGLVILILFLAFGNLRGVVLPMLTVIISSTWAMGLMAALKIPITMLSNSIPVLLIALGTAYAIHLLHKVDETHPTQGQDQTQSLVTSLVDVMIPIGLAGLTTVVGFLSFLTSDLLFMQQFGLMTAFGIFCAMVVALTLLPAILSFIQLRSNKNKTIHNKKLEDKLAGRLLAGLGSFVVRRNKLVLIVAVVVAVVCIAFIPRLDRKFSMVDYFPEDSDVQKADKMMREKMGGNVQVWVTVDGNPKHPFVLQQMITVEKYLRTLAGISNVKSVASIIAQINQVMTDRLTVPKTLRGVGNLWFNLEGKAILDQVVDKSKKHALIQAVTANSNTAELRKIVASLERFLSHLPQQAVRVDLNNANSELAKKAKQSRWDLVVDHLYYDLTYRLGSVVDRAQIVVWLRDALSRVGTLPRRATLEALRRFLSSDEADIEIADDGLIQKLSLAVYEQAVAQQILGLAALNNIILSVLPKKTIEADPEGISYLAKSLSQIVAETKNKNLIHSVRAVLLDKLSAKARSNPRLIEDIEGDLWSLTSSVVWLPTESVHQPGGDKTLVGCKFQQTGMHHISVNVDNRLVYSQLSSLGLAVVVALLLLMIQFRSVVAGLLGMIPMVLTLLVNFGVMGALGIALEPSTVLIASVVVGVGIDYTIHFLSRMKLEQKLSGDMGKALDVVQRTAGRAILINAITVAAGQLVFLAGTLAPMHQFGSLLALAMVTSAFAAVSVIPAVMAVSNPKFFSA